MDRPKFIRREQTTPGIWTVTLTRPEVRNALNDQVIREMTQTFRDLASDESLRVVVLRGEGQAFCAGADIDWMKSSANLDEAANLHGAQKLHEMFAAVVECPVPVVAVVHGHALGGGCGLVAAADIALVQPDAKLGFTEVLLGIVPAVISPFVLRRIPEIHARRYFLSGEIFDGREAARIGLVQKCVPLAMLEEETHSLITAFTKAGPLAVRAAKKLILQVAGSGFTEASSVTVPLIASLRRSPEAQEGMAAFFAKRPPAWIQTQ